MQPTMVLRSIYITEKMDQEIGRIAKEKGVLRSELFLKYLMLGMKEARKPKPVLTKTGRLVALLKETRDVVEEDARSMRESTSINGKMVDSYGSIAEVARLEDLVKRCDAELRLAGAVRKTAKKASTPAPKKVAKKAKPKVAKKTARKAVKKAPKKRKA